MERAWIAKAVLRATGIAARIPWAGLTPRAHRRFCTVRAALPLLLLHGSITCAKADERVV